jgi:hypothetical protein
MASEITQRQRAEANCHQCGMVCQPDEYHPYAACILYGAIHDGDAVRANLNAIAQHARQEALREAAKLVNHYNCMHNHGKKATKACDDILEQLDRLEP